MGINVTQKVKKGDVGENDRHFYKNLPKSYKDLVRIGPKLSDVRSQDSYQFEVVREK